MSKSTHRPPLVVRLMPDHADTALWFAHGPVDYESANLTASLEHDLADWERLYYEIHRAAWDDSERPAPARAEVPVREVAHTAAGVLLAKRLATELGAHFTIQFDDAKTERERWHHSPAPASNPAAEAAFLALEAEDKLERDEIAAIRSAGGKLQWTAE